MISIRAPTWRNPVDGLAIRVGSLQYGMIDHMLDHWELCECDLMFCFAFLRSTLSSTNRHLTYLKLQDATVVEPQGVEARCLLGPCNL